MDNRLHSVASIVGMYQTDQAGKHRYIDFDFPNKKYYPRNQHDIQTFTKYSDHFQLSE